MWVKIVFTMDFGTTLTMISSNGFPQIFSFVGDFRKAKGSGIVSLFVLSFWYQRCGRGALVRWIQGPFGPQLGRGDK